MTATDTSSAYRRVRRPKDKEGVIQALQDGGVFREIRDVLVFAAAVGFSQRRRVPFTESGEAIRWETFVNRRGSEALVDMIAAVEAPEDDVEILSVARSADRILMFEEYANGGLEFLAHELVGVRSNFDVIAGLVRSALDEPHDRDELEKLLFGPDD